MIKIVIIKNGQNGNCGCYIVVRSGTTMRKQLPRALACSAMDNGSVPRIQKTNNLGYRLTLLKASDGVYMILYSV